MHTAAAEPYKSTHKVRFVTATSLFDGHDASTNIIRRILQASGAEVIHLGHNRSVDEIVTAAIQEDAQGIAVSCYQGGHLEFFKYIKDQLRERGAEQVRIFGGGGGVIIPDEIKELEAYGIAKIFSPEDGRRLGLQGMINLMMEQCDFAPQRQIEDELAKLQHQDIRAVNTLITLAEQAVHDHTTGYGALRETIRTMTREVPVVGITGTGGAGKSSLTDELVRRFLRDFPGKSVAILAVDPSRQRTGGALLGDRIRMNAINTSKVYMRSLATRDSHSELSAAIKDAIDVVKAAGFDLVFVETSGIGQGDARVVDIADVSLYVMTCEFGAPTQLEKIDMLDFADLVALNKFERKGSEDALRNVRKQYRRNRNLFEVEDEALPVFGTIAAQFNDPGTNVLYRALLDTLNAKNELGLQSQLAITEKESLKRYIIPTDRIHYLGEIVQAVRGYRKRVMEQVGVARRLFQLTGARELVSSPETTAELDLQVAIHEANLHAEPKKILADWPCLKETYRQDQLVTRVRDKEIRSDLYTT
ncbi:MAG TPA: cobalamin-dependent protein, partial [Geobacteraceae bacterium]